MNAYAVIGLSIAIGALIIGWVGAVVAGDDLTDTAALAVGAIPVAAIAGFLWPLTLLVGIVVAARYARDNPRPAKPRPLTESEKYDAMAREESRAANEFTRAGQPELSELHRGLAQQYRGLAGQARASETTGPS